MSSKNTAHGSCKEFGNIHIADQEVLKSAGSLVSSEKTVWSREGFKAGQVRGRGVNKTNGVILTLLQDSFSFCLVPPLPPPLSPL